MQKEQVQQLQEQVQPRMEQVRRFEEQVRLHLIQRLGKVRTTKEQVLSRWMQKEQVQRLQEQVRMMKEQAQYHFHHLEKVLLSKE